MDNLDRILKILPDYRPCADRVRDLLLADLVMIGEIPAPTFHERERMEFILNRFQECGLQHCSIDEKGNGMGILPGESDARHLLLVAHADTFVTEREDQTIEIQKDRLIGPFVGDNSIALAVLTTLPRLLDEMKVRLRSSLVFLASTRAMGRGNLDGLRFFLETNQRPLYAGLCLEGVQLGRLNYNCMGMLRAEVHCRLPPDYNWAQYGNSGSIIPASEVVNRISRIPLPKRPLSSMIIGSIHGGITCNNIARETTLAFEVRSESMDILTKTREQIEDITEEVAAHSGTLVTLDVVAQREPGGLDIGHPLVRKGRAVLSAIGLQPAMYATTSQLAALRDVHLPALTVGMTTGERRNELDEIDEYVAIEPMTLGLIQVAGLLMAIDEGLES